MFFGFVCSASNVLLHPKKSDLESQPPILGRKDNIFISTELPSIQIFTVTLLKMTLFPPGSSDLWSWRWPSSIFSDNNQKSWSWNEWRERLLMRLEYNRYWTENAKHLEKCWAKVQLYF
ncbi:unnamed protein product [Cuscuta epithymum]|uniref:Uncharacterized protein n=1 Tax=Cuscuta epithymum TaxID=186058 RepID=A0AAV0FA80_9ASTE|nr:unnamed protein product [Cuscuta epithymum]